MLGQNQTTCNNVIGSANYDIGHVFSTGGGGVAQLGVPCGSSKAKGVTGLPNPVGDAFRHRLRRARDGTSVGRKSHLQWHRRVIAAVAIDPLRMPMSRAAALPSWLMPEFATTRTWRPTASILSTSTASKRSSPTAKPAAATLARSRPPPATRPPTVTGPGNFNIPKQTPFSLTASATDPNGDTITYDWQEFDLGGLPEQRPFPIRIPMERRAQSSAPILPTAGGTRTFPSLQYILNNANVPPSTNGSCPSDACLTGELLPAITRTMTFQVVARDNRANGGGINTATSIR